jgi:ferredoxin
VPAQLLTVPGIRRDRKKEQVAFVADPLKDINRQFPKPLKEIHRQNWDAFLPIWGARTKAEIKARATTQVRPVLSPSPPEPVTLTSDLKQRAGELGLSAIGIAEYDPKYTYARFVSECADAGNRVIVCLVESNFEALQTIPSAHSERAVQVTSYTTVDLAAELSYYLHGRGFRAAALIPYAVEAGLGQLGRNGQLLTPVAGSRVRMAGIQTDAPLICDSPADYGVTGLCDACMVCVNRCPPSAIPNRRNVYRGIEKSKINIARCFPVMIKAHGCAVCTKVCPVQKFGLQPVLDEFARSGRVLGKDTDDLEGYDWMDGRHYGPGRRPKIDKTIFQGLGFDAPLDPAPHDDESLQTPGTTTSLM